jgi:CheY-like chemotaxis protein
MNIKSKILVIDDDEINLWLLKETLVPKGYEVLTAGNGEKGIALAIKSKPDLILLDIIMPVMDGYATLSKLKDNPETKSIPVIMVTAVGSELNKRLADSMGIAGYVTKPIDFAILLAEIKRYLPDK